ncbi:DoxX family protein [Lewinella sp. 4G2]|uniref:DoxX family protein n=1 Tax=Lewinella sp. 4G2 TaxID=1803372 RepID=UPI0007B4F435|nr:DoxX family protein [Lewinella sp. 4G2]OAV46284.1 hypothetical protein A3850_018695 [Lewinella sp. 4G2]
MNKQKIGLILLGLVGFALLGSGVIKFVKPAEFAAEMNGNTMAPYILGVVELIALAALAIPRTRLLGVILAASYWGGAMAFSWLHAGEMPIAPIVLSVLTYVGAYLYRPSLGDGSPTTQVI